MPVSLVKV